jgi:hypothetical protein
MPLSDSNRTSDLDNTIIEIESGDASGNKATVNSENRLLVDAKFDIIPSSNGRIIYKSIPLANSGSPLMNVNGSVTPVYFTWSVPANETWYLENIRLFFNDVGAQDPNKFANLATLTNGLDVLIKANGTEYTYANFKNNIEILMSTNRNFLPTDTSGFLSSTDVFIGDINLQNPIKLTNSTSDLVRIKVQDNLTAIDYFYSSILVWKAL